jgi:phosphoenolpyruvate synthase/pyruvate phosphate dikinase
LTAIKVAAESECKMPAIMTLPAILWFQEIAIADVPLVGGKNASLGEMVRELGTSGVRIPAGFATTAAAYRGFIAACAVEPAMREHIRRYRTGEISLQEAGGAIRELLNVCLRCFASLFTDRAISYCEAKGFDHFAIALSIVVQQMVRADLGGSGVIFSIDTKTGFPGVTVISGAWGLGETVVQGSVDLGKYAVFKPLLDKPGARPIIEKTRGANAIKMVYADGDSKRTRIVETSPAERHAFVLTGEEILELGHWAVIVERHYGRPMDLEWAMDGETGLLYLVKARPETVQSGISQSRLLHY